MKLLILGKQGCGKGTQGKMIAERYRIPNIVTGDILRRISQEKTKTGEELKKLLAEGKLAPNELTNKLVLNEIKSKKDFILDGFPRSAEQVGPLEKNVKVDLVILLEISDKVAIKRISARRNCPQCAELYNLITKKPKKDEICDKCKIPLAQREDDKEQAIKERLAIYKKQTQPIINFYKKKGILREFNGELPPEEVFKDISVVLDKLNKLKNQPTTNKSTTK